MKKYRKKIQLKGGGKEENEKERRKHRLKGEKLPFK